MIRIVLFSILITLSSNLLFGQILDDSTKQVYGPETTFFFYPDDVEYAEIAQYNPDTTVNLVHRYNWQTINDNYYLDLGNLGTALYPVYYTPKRNIGVNYGINIYDEYFTDPRKMRYFNTRSPFTELSYVQGANNFAHLTADFSRNINPLWNTSFSVDRFSSDKSLANVGRDRLVEHWNFSFSSNYRSKNKRYFILYGFSHLSHEVEEQGGIKPLESDRIPDDLYLYQSANVWLNDAYTWERRNNHHIYQHFNFIPDTIGDFKIFHEFDRINVKNQFSDNGIAESDTFYNFTAFENPVNSKFRLQYTLYENKIGLTGSTKSEFRFKGYYRNRYYYNNLANDWAIENFIGGEIGKRIKFSRDSINIAASAEIEAEGDFRLGFKLSEKRIGLELYKVNSSPNIIQNRVKSNNFIWNNNFNRTSSDNVDFTYKLSFGKQVFEPIVSWHGIRNYIYYDQSIAPAQESDYIIITDLGFRSHFQFWKIKFDNSFKWVSRDGPNVIRFPEYFAQGTLYFETRISRGKSTFQFGLEAFYRSAFFGNQYMPAIFQYHLQDNFLLQEAIVPDIFVSFQFRKAQAFLKVPYFTQGWAVPGYFSSPYYTGVVRPDAVSIGFRWQFYD